MPQERLDLNQLMENMVAFARLPEARNFILSGPVKDEPIDITAVAGLYSPHTLSNEPTCLIATISPEEKRKKPQHHHSQILKLKIPDRIIAQNIPDEPALRAMSELRSVLNLMPYIVIAFGHFRSTKEEVIILSTPNGISPQTALKEFQENSRSRLTTFN